MRRYLWPVLATTLSLSGCSSMDQPSVERSPLPASLTSPCDPLPELTDGTAANVLRWIVGASETYHACSRKHGALVEAVR